MRRQGLCPPGAYWLTGERTLSGRDKCKEGNTAGGGEKGRPELDVKAMRGASERLCRGFRLRAEECRGHRLHEEQT